MLPAWRLLLNPALPGFRQMAIDEALYRLAAPDQAPVVRFYTWQNPTLSLGFFQDYKKVVCESFIVHNNIDVVRRITGGRAVLHHDELTYAIAAPLSSRFENQSLQETYRLIAEALNLGLLEMGFDQSSIFNGTQPAHEGRLPQCFVTVSKYEISKETRKMIGSAQKRSRDRFIQHGSILLDFDPYLQNGCVNHPDPEIEKRVAPLNRLLGRKLSFPETASCFRKGFERFFDVALEDSALTVQEEQMISELEHKYSSSNWTHSGCR